MGAAYLWPSVWSRARDRPELALPHPPRLTALNLSAQTICLQSTEHAEAHGCLITLG
jgi:hypothetical protein